MRTGVYEALREAQLWALRKPDELNAAVRAIGIQRGSDPQPVDPKLRAGPYYWAAFTLSGDWR